MLKKYSDLVDISSLQKLLDSLYDATGMPSAILDVDANVLTESGWQEICTDFHRAFPESAVQCRNSDEKITENLHCGSFYGYRCKNGLLDYACPIVIAERHFATLFVGQFFTEKPDEDYFREQAKRYGFAQEKYLEALKKVPVIPQEKVEKILGFYSQLAVTLANMGHQVLQYLNEIQFNETLMEAIPNPVFYKDKDRKYLGCNKAFEKFLGLPKESIIGKTVYDISPNQLAAKYEEKDVALLENPAFQSYEYAVADVTGRKHTVIFNKATIKNNDGGIIGLVGVMVDITERKDMEARLKESEGRYRALFTHMINGFLYLEAVAGINGTIDTYVIHDVNEAFEEILGVNREDIAGKNVEVVLFDAQMKENWLDLFRQVDTRGESAFLEHYSKHFQKWLLISAYSPQRGHVAVVVSDITQKKKNDEQIQHYAYHDTLTGLPNRRLLDDRLSVAIAQASRDREVMAVIYLDVDKFKTINDSLGHDVGDNLLQQIAKRLVSTLREGDTVSRVGGDEFVLVLPKAKSKVHVEEIATRLLETCRKPFTVNRQKIAISVSIGISCYPQAGVDVAELMRSADMAMYLSKRKGRNQICFAPDC